VMGTATETAGVAVPVTVRALDANDNIVDDSITSVLLLQDVGAGTPVFGGANPAVLVAGSLQTTVTFTTAETVRIRAETSTNSAIFGTGTTVLISPDVPAGVITAAVERLQSLGCGQAEEVRLVDESVTFALPPELKRDAESMRT